MIHENVGLHLNINPTNLFLDTTHDTAVFGGFGNTTKFLSPIENVIWRSKDGTPSKSSDIFSLGLCFLYFLQKVLNVDVEFGRKSKHSLGVRLKRIQILTKRNKGAASFVDILTEMVQKRPKPAEIIALLETWTNTTKTKTQHSLPDKENLV